MPADCIAVIDLETTGLSPWRHDRVVEIAVVMVSPDGHVQREYDTLLNPGRDIGPSCLHRISATDVLRAPSFSQIAGDVLNMLKDASAIAGHNVSSVANFLVSEYQRLDVSIPDIPLLCTCRLFGRSSLASCCHELKIDFDGMPHRALSDARVTARLVSFLCADDPSLLDNYRLRNVLWPTLPALRTPCFCREEAVEASREPPRFLQRLLQHVHHDVEADEPNVLAYAALIDRVLEDRTIDVNEEDTLVRAALDWRLSPSQLASVHEQYLRSLAIAALEDGVVSDSERRDLHLVARLLGQDCSTIDTLLDSVNDQLACTHKQMRRRSELVGKTVCFTGELQSTLRGSPITRELAEAIAEQAGLIVASSVTKKLDILVVADPNTQSSKAKKAHKYGIRILSDTVFWKLAGITVE